MLHVNTKDNENRRRRRDRPLGLSNRKGTNLKVCPYSVVFGGDFQVKKILSLLVIVFVVISLKEDAGAFEFKGFANIDFETVKGSDNNEHKYGSFIVGGMDLYISEVINDRLDILGEILIDPEEGLIDLERFHVGYIFVDAIKIRTGRFHTPLGFWNISYHHGAQLQPTIDRPEILKFEDDGGVLPTHTIGINAVGRFKAGDSVFMYDIMLGNGDQIIEDDNNDILLYPNVDSDNNSNKSIAFSFSAKPGFLQNLKVGISGNYQRVHSKEGLLVDGSPVDIDILQTIIVPAFLFNVNGFEIGGDYFYIRNKDKNGIDEDKINNGYYILLTYSLNEQWMPYVLTESRNVEAGDKYFSALSSGDLNETIVGIKYNTNYRSCIKAEGRLVDDDNDKYNEYAIQWAVSF